MIGDRSNLSVGTDRRRSSLCRYRAKGGKRNHYFGTSDRNLTRRCARTLVPGNVISKSQRAGLSRWSPVPDGPPSQRQGTVAEIFRERHIHALCQQRWRRNLFRVSWRRSCGRSGAWCGGERTKLVPAGPGIRKTLSHRALRSSRFRSLNVFS